MSWKKNAFSFFIWLLYIVLAGASLIFANAMLVDYMGYLPQYGILCAGVIVLVEGILVLLVHKLQGATADKDEQQRGKTATIICEVIAVLAFLVVGIMTRVEGLRCITDVDSSMPYFELAKIAAGHSVPQIVHGAEYLYLQLLHFVFFIMGNKISMAFWMQVILQLIACLVLHRAVRRMIGKVPSIIFFALMMSSSWMVKEVVYLSPNMMLLLGFAVVLWAISLAANATKLCMPIWLLIGALISSICYMDIVGLTLLLPAIGAIFASRKLENEGLKKCFGALGMCILGFIVLFCGIIISDALLCGRDILSVFLAWFRVYTPGYFQLYDVFSNMSFSLVTETVVVLALFFVGVFTYWCRPKFEKFSVWVCEIILVLLAQCFQFTTTEVNGRVFLYVFVTILASIGVAELFAGKNAEVAVEMQEDRTDNTLEIMELDEVDLGSVELQGIEVEMDESEYEESEPEVVEIEYIPNPLPLPKKHEKKVLDYALHSTEEDDFDFKIEDDDDFDIL